MHRKLELHFPVRQPGHGIRQRVMCRLQCLRSQVCDTTCAQIIAAN